MFKPDQLTSLLTRQRSAVFDPCFGEGRLLRATQNGPLVNLYGFDADPANRSSLIRSVIGPAQATWPLLRAVAGQFDLAVCEPPDESWSAKNMPTPPHRPGANFGLGQRRVIAIDATMHAVQATWLMMNNVLTPLGEGLMVVSEAHAKQFIAPCAFARRIWLWLQLPDGRAAIYFAVDHRGPRITQAHADELFENPARIRKIALHGETVKDDYNSNQDAERRFEAVRAEWQRLNGEESHLNLWMRAGKLAFHVTSFQLLSGDVTRELQVDGNRLNGRSPVDLMALKEDRLLFERIIGDKRLRIHPQMPKVFEETLAEYAHASAPFSRPSAIQRVAWLDEHERVKCRRSWESFVAKETYAVSSSIFEGHRKETRHRSGHGIEEVLVTGQELMMIIVDSEGKAHAFTQHPLSHEEQAKQPAIHAFHALLELTRNFELPDVPDIVESDPDTYTEMLRRLEALETA